MRGDPGEQSEKRREEGGREAMSSSFEIRRLVLLDEEDESLLDGMIR